ncbi:MAG: hypothetical protein ACI8P3_004446 [Saprospiraceae bacterium]|jgi:hypothetical protein
MEQNTDQNSPEAKSNRRVGGLVMLIVLIFGGGYFLYLILPNLISLTGSILYLAFFLILIVGFLVLVFHPRTRFLIGSFINSLFRKR